MVLIIKIKMQANTNETYIQERTRSMVEAEHRGHSHLRVKNHSSLERHSLGSNLSQEIVDINVRRQPLEPLDHQSYKSMRPLRDPGAYIKHPARGPDVFGHREPS